ncbi:hypothetical protein Tco_1320827 [Tanacetum coccineum]
MEGVHPHRRFLGVGLTRSFLQDFYRCDCIFAEVEPPFKEESITDEEMMLYFAQEHDNSFHPKEFDDDDAEFVDFIFSMYGTTSLDGEEEEPAASVVDNFSTFQQVCN